MDWSEPDSYTILHLHSFFALKQFVSTDRMGISWMGNRGIKAYASHSLAIFCGTILISLNNKLIDYRWLVLKTGLSGRIRLLCRNIAIAWMPSLLGRYIHHWAQKRGYQSDAVIRIVNIQYKKILWLNSLNEYGIVFLLDMPRLWNTPTHDLQWKVMH